MTMKNTCLVRLHAIKLTRPRLHNLRPSVKIYAAHVLMLFWIYVTAAVY